jgi:hypothetical protein
VYIQSMSVQGSIPGRCFFLFFPDKDMRWNGTKTGSTNTKGKLMGCRKKSHQYIIFDSTLL